MLRKLKFQASWWKLKRQLRRRGIHWSGLPRVDEFAQTRMRLRKPDYVSSLQKPTGFIPSLTSRPWHDPSEYDWVRRLEDATPVICSELEALRHSGHFLTQHQGIAEDGDWRVFYLYNYEDRIDENCALVPETTKIIESIPQCLHAGRIYFSAMTPGTVVRPHCGPINTRLRCHLGLEIPQDCGIKVGGETRSWEENRCLIFDDSYEHEVWNHSSDVRSILILDFWHPDLEPEEIHVIQKLQTLRPGLVKLTEKIRRADGPVLRTEPQSTVTEREKSAVEKQAVSGDS